ncbi:MAG: bacillithiol biosynthesis cysteine-adding enzyme BshC [Acidobacteriaceae bacterium]|nr:bacillithiol biosynthesis cysteine-adding enzyme BshC [Acidobacteriaceae bacterium]
MNAECLSISTLPGTSALFRAFCEGAPEDRREALLRWYPAKPFRNDWAKDSPSVSAEHATRLADALKTQSESFGADAAVLASVEKLRAGAAAVITGQQVGLFGGPLLTVLKAATAIRKAKDATEASGREHVPVFWLASEDHDLAEVDQLALLTKTEVETLSLGLSSERPVPVGGLKIDRADTLSATVERACELFAWGPLSEVLEQSYAAGETLSSAFARFLTKIFAGTGLIVLDAASRAFHALGAKALRGAIEEAESLEALLLARTAELESLGYHAQVLVTAGQSLLFLLEEESGARQALKRLPDGLWKAGAKSFTTAQLLEILEKTPERVSPNALLRPIFQDTIFPTAAYIGGPAEVAYFAQSAVVFEKLLGRITPVLPRLSATLVEPSIAALLAQHEVSLEQVWQAGNVDALALRLGARAMPIEAKRKLAAVGNAMEEELAALTTYADTLNPELGKAAGVSASKMRYQMNRLRRLMAQFELQKEASLRKHATAMLLHLLPEGHLQERVLGGIWFLAKEDASALVASLVEFAGLECPGHRVLYL